MAVCSTCARSKGTNRASAGLLQPLPTPHCTWSHISIDFFNGLQPSDTNSTILTVVEGFSKMVHFILNKKLPSACVQTPRFSSGHGLRQRVTVRLSVLEDVLQPSGATVSVTSRYQPRTPVSNSSPVVRKPLVFSHNSLPSVSMGFSPFECEPPLFQALEQEVSVPSCSGGVVGLGSGYCRPSSRFPPKSRPIADTSVVQTSRWVSGCGCPPAIFH